MTPMLCGHTNPFLRGREERGEMRSRYPSGTFTITLPGTRPIFPGAMTVVSRVMKSNPTDPSVSYCGRGREGSMRCIATCISPVCLRQGMLYIALKEINAIEEIEEIKDWDPSCASSPDSRITRCC